ncbi:MAG: pyrrolidone-carboxylate peptidase [Alphaproteobacteria bacterium]
MRPILVTGFTPFASHDANPSAMLVERFAADGVSGVAVEAMLVDVLWESAAARVIERYDRLRPSAVICFGLAGERDRITIERFAVNVDDTATADNVGIVRAGVAIRTDGPDAYRSTLPLAAMARAVAAEGVPVAFSNHAGAFLCNHVFYAIRDRIAQAGEAVPAGFVHLPPYAAVPAEDQWRAARRLVAAVGAEVGIADERERLAG